MNKKLIAVVAGVCFLTGCDRGNAAADTHAAKVLADNSVANMVPVVDPDEPFKPIPHDEMEQYIALINNNHNSTTQMA